MGIVASDRQDACRGIARAYGPRVRNIATDPPGTGEHPAVFDRHCIGKSTVYAKNPSTSDCRRSIDHRFGSDAESPGVNSGSGAAGAGTGQSPDSIAFLDNALEIDHLVEPDGSFAVKDQCISGSMVTAIDRSIYNRAGTLSCAGE